MTVLDEPSTSTHRQLDELALRHLDMVYGAALRHMRDPHAAADVTQAVFLILQQKLPTLKSQTLLPLWLLQTTRYACLAARRQQRRREYHEAKVKAMQPEVRGEVPMDDQLLQRLDQALARLSYADRTALVMSYFEHRSHAQVGARMGISEQTARKRVQRAIDKLRKMLGRRGSAVSQSGVIGGLASLSQGTPPPADVMTVVQATCLGGGVPAQVSTIAKGAMTMVKLFKLKLTAMATLALATAGVVAAAGYQLAYTAAAPLAAPAVVPGPNPQAADGYGPMISLLVRSDNAANPDTIADLDNAKLSTLLDLGPRGPSAFGAMETASEKGFDVMYEGGRQMVMGFDLAVTQRPDEEFERASTDEPLMVYLLAASPATVSINTRALPATYAFRTREGSVGIMQIMEEVPPTDLKRTNGGVVIRVKVLRPEVHDRLAARNAASLLVPDFQRKLSSLDSTTGKDQTLTSARALMRSANALWEIARGTPIAGAAARALAAVRRVQEATMLEDDAQTLKAIEELKKMMPAVVEEIQNTAAKLSREG